MGWESDITTSDVESDREEPGQPNVMRELERASVRKNRQGRFKRGEHRMLVQKDAKDVSCRILMNKAETKR